ncbi:phage/plasmid primase, P4 family [Pseudomonas sp. GX19020]|uniref:DNA primase family protein n=1 Tax=Pseudomonas sp. GX19020 TaxID=2942277 RepID=UPI002019E20C|nr:phage/plasmid primase, P4 family [Pseudomonas sp. GX19020]MCL4069015.1 phage/plasmid primase, P4 family [Pseudomonas sp. GX19020]
MSQELKPGLARVREVMSQAEDVDMPEGLEVPSEHDHDAPIGDEDLGYDDRATDPPHPPDDESAPPPEKECAELPLNDHGNGQRFVRYFGDMVRWVPTLGWHVWSGTHFQLDQHNIRVRYLAQQLGERIAKEIPWLTLEDWQMEAIGRERDLREELKALSETLDDDGKPSEETRSKMADIDKKLGAINSIKKVLGDKRKAHRNFARTAGNTSRIDAALKEAAPHISLTHTELDSDAMAVNCLSGTLRFEIVSDPDAGMSKVATVRLDPHSQDDKISKVIMASYNPERPFSPRTDCPKFMAFLNRVQPAAEMRGYLQRWLGLSISGLSVQALMFWYGAGANGKSVLIELIAKIMGEYAAEIRIETLTGKNSQSGAQATPDLVYLVGARLARAGEPREGEPLQDSLVKSITSGEPIMVRPNYGAFFRLYPYFKLTMSGNHKPDIRSTDDGIWRRIKLVPWEVQIPERERDDTLLDKLWEERDGILKWLVQGLLDYLEGGLQEPDAVRNATEEYRDDSDPVGSFLSSCCFCTGDDKNRIPSRELTMAFHYWMARRGETKWGDKRVQMRLREKVDRKWKSPRDGLGFGVVKSSGVPTYVGIRFDDDFGPRFKDCPKDTEGRPVGAGQDY